MTFEIKLEDQLYDIHTKQNPPNVTDKTSYLLGTDSHEIERLNRQHEALKIICKGNFGAPLEEQLRNGINVLDSACGTGLWTTDMGKKYPKSNFVGLDLSTMFSNQETNMPSNCKFLQHDVTQPLPFPDHHFDYIHQRFIIAGVREHGWPQIIVNLMRVLKPGGWIELSEPLIAEIANAGPKYTSINKAVNRNFAKRGTRLSTCRELELYLTNAGVLNIEATPFLFPIQHGEIGKLWCKDNLIESYRQVLKPMMLQEFPKFKDPNVYEHFLSELVQECEEYKPYMIVTRFFGQKPE